MAEQTKAAQLKEEGNKLYAQEDYEKAYAKYTEAITEDAANAVLYANRAACSLGMRSYQKAANDAEEATKLNPGYAKAWARLAIAQEALSISDTNPSVHAWQKALDSLPKENLTPGEQQQKIKYSIGLREAKRPRIIQLSGVAGNMPWECAKAMKPELIARGYEPEALKSSAWVIMNAYEEFIEGVELMKKLKKVQTPSGWSAMGRLDGLAGLTNGILRDERVFHMDDPNWLSMLDDQVKLEVTNSNAWFDAKPDVVIMEAQQRLRQQGWGALRPALSTTVRVWIMRGFLEGGLRRTKSVQVEFLGYALELLDWGSEAWKDVPKADRGAIFQRSFIRGVRSLHINAFMEAYAQDPGPNSRFPLEDILEEADYILREIREHDPRPTDGEEYDPGFLSSFYIYPAAQATSMKGYYHAQMARRYRPETDAATATVKDHLRKSGNFYIEAASMYPEDDEKHAYFLNCGVHNLFGCGTPLRETLAVLKRIRLAIPKMKRIWGSSAMAKEGRDAILDRALKTEKEALAQIEKGNLTLDDLRIPEWRN